MRFLVLHTHGYRIEIHKSRITRSELTKKEVMGLVMSSLKHRLHDPDSMVALREVLSAYFEHLGGTCVPC